MDFLGSVKDGKFLDLLSDYQLLRLNSVPWSLIIGSWVGHRAGLPKRKIFGPVRNTSPLPVTLPHYLFHRTVSLWESNQRRMDMTHRFKDDCLLRCCAVQSGRNWPTFQKRLLHQSSGRPDSTAAHGVLTRFMAKQRNPTLPVCHTAGPLEAAVSVNRVRTSPLFPYSTSIWA
jgi:hypothetical protein